MPGNVERILRKTVTYEYIERATQRFIRDRRNSLSKLPQITGFLRDSGYEDEDLIMHDDVVFAIETLVGTDPRTVRRYIKLLMEHHYLTPTSTKQGAIVYSRSFVQVRSKWNTSTREYQVEQGYKFYMFGPRATRSYQKKLVPPLTSPSRSDESQSQKNMCVSHRAAESTRNGYGHVEVGEKKEEEVVLHTHIVNSVIDKNGKTNIAERTADTKSYTGTFSEGF